MPVGVQNLPGCMITDNNTKVRLARLDRHQALVQPEDVPFKSESS